MKAPAGTTPAGALGWPERSQCRGEPLRFDELGSVLPGACGPPSGSKLCAGHNDRQHESVRQPALGRARSFVVLRDDPASVGGCLLATDRPLSQAAAGLADDKFPVKDVWPSARCSSSTSWTAILAIPGIGWATTVRGGQENSESLVLSKATTARSSGTRRPRSCAARSRPTACRSEPAKTAVGASTSPTGGAHPHNRLRVTSPLWRSARLGAPQREWPVANPAREGPRWGCPCRPPPGRWSRGGEPAPDARLRDRRLGDRRYRGWRSRAPCSEHR